MMYARMRSPHAVHCEAQRSGAPQMRGPGFFLINRGPGSAAHHFVLRCARDTN
jgi:hypothetical protein